MEEVRRLVARIRDLGHDVLLEDEAYSVARALGLVTPVHSVVPPGGSVRDGVDGPVVVKARSRTLAHKAAAGGVRVVDPGGDVAAALQSMEALATDGWLVADRIGHDSGFPGEWLLGVRRTRGFGPVVTLGPGGSAAEWLAGAIGPAASLTLVPGMDPAVEVAEWPAAEVLTAAEREALAGMLAGVLDAVRDLPDEIVEFECNPVVLTDDGPVVLDALCRLGDVDEPVPPRPIDWIDRLLHPEGIAIVGVSDRMNPGRVILRNVLGFGFPPDRVTVVKPGTEQIDGVRCVPDLAALAPVDLLVVAVGAEAAAGVVDEAADLGCAASIVLVAGGAGERPGTEPIERRIKDSVARSRQEGSTGPVVNGANCMGIRSVAGGFDALFIPPHKWSPARGADHPVGVVAQSGAFVLSRLDRMPWLDPRYVITVGNQIDLTVGDHAAYLAERTDIRVLALYVEGFAPGDGTRVCEAVRTMRRRGGEVVVLLGGRSELGAETAITHTASIAGDNEVGAALLAGAGALVAGDLAEFDDLLRLAVMLPAGSTGRRIGMVSNAGFETVAMADALGGLAAADLGPETVAGLDRLLADSGLDRVVAGGNPLDLTPMADDATFVDAVRLVLADPGVDLGVVGCVPFTPALSTLPADSTHDEDVEHSASVARRLVDLAADGGTPFVAVVDAGDAYAPMVRVLEASGIPVFATANRAVRLLNRWADR
jgi:acyl-CoA synthetase (NDP forming)